MIEMPQPSKTVSFLTSFLAMFVFVFSPPVCLAQTGSAEKGHSLEVLEMFQVAQAAGESFDQTEIFDVLEEMDDDEIREIIDEALQETTPEDLADQFGVSVDEIEAVRRGGARELRRVLEQSDIIDRISTDANVQEIEDPRGLSRSGHAEVGDDSDKLDVLDLKNMDILDVLKLISQKSGVNIVAGQNVKGRVTVYLKNVGVEEALKIIVEAYGWAYAKEGNIIKVMTAQDFEARYGHKFGEDIRTKIKQLLYAQASDLVAILNQVKSDSGKVIADEKSSTLILMDKPEKIGEMQEIIERIDVPVSTEVFNLTYAKAEDLSTKISEALTPGVGKMRFDGRSNKIIVSDTPLKLEEVSKIINAFDQKDREVLIESKIIQITLNDEHKLGVDWELMLNDFHQLDFAGDFDILQESEKRGKVSIGTLSDDEYTATLEALDTVGNVEILSSPRIATINNQEAKILVGSSEPYVTQTTTTPSSGPVTTSETINFIEVGVKLFVTPTIHPDDFITMKIKPEVSSVVDTLNTANNNTIPVVGTSEAETTIIIKDGVTVVIGGLIEEEKRSTIKKVPLLGDIPVIKHVFSNENTFMQKREIVIFLKPQIMSGDIENSALSKGLR